MRSERSARCRHWQPTHQRSMRSRLVRCASSSSNLYSSSARFLFCGHHCTNVLRTGGNDSQCTSPAEEALVCSASSSSDLYRSSAEEYLNHAGGSTALCTLRGTTPASTALHTSVQCAVLSLQHRASPSLRYAAPPACFAAPHSVLNQCYCTHDSHCATGHRCVDALAFPGYKLCKAAWKNQPGAILAQMTPAAVSSVGHLALAAASNVGQKTLAAVGLGQ